MEEIIIDDPQALIGKRVIVVSSDGDSTIGEFCGYNYDYDDDDNMFIEFDVEDADGFLNEFTENEVKSIAVL